MNPNATHSFIVEEAKTYGVEPAILLNNLRFWLEKNRANKKHIHDGYVWTYNSGEAFAELFPYMKRRTISMNLKSLCDAGILKSACYNSAKYDRTLWYTIIAEFATESLEKPRTSITAPLAKNGASIGENCQSIGENCQSIGENCQPIPDINTDINTDKSVVVVREDNFFNLTQEQSECKNWATTQNYWASCTQSDNEFLKVWCKPSGALRKQFNAHKKALQDGLGQTGLNVNQANKANTTGVNYATHYATNKPLTATQRRNNLDRLIAEQEQRTSDNDDAIISTATIVR
jgi:hypothetical protein